MSARKVVVIADVQKGAFRPAVLDLAAMADQIAVDSRDDVRWLAVGSGASEAGDRLAELTGYPVTALPISPDVPVTGELLGNLLQSVLTEWRPDIIGLLHSVLSQDHAASLAISLGAAYVAGVQGIVRHEHDWSFQRAVMGGRLLAEIRTDGRPVVLTLLPGYFRHEARPRPPAPVDTRRLPLPITRTRLIATRAAESEATLCEADTIVAAGRGVGTREHLVLIEKLASCFSRAAVAGSRLICDAGWLAYNRQVGITGATVAPGLYLACGISGAYQHVAGMQGAKLIVAINKDSRAAIFNTADIGVVEDVATFLPLLIEALENG